MEKMANWGYLRSTKSSLNARKVLKRIRRMRGKNLCVHGEDTKILLTYSPNTPKNIKVCLSRLIIIRILNCFRFFLSTSYGMDLMDQAKKPSHATVPLIDHKTTVW
jgi:hypothetical protein